MIYQVALFNKLENTIIKNRINADSKESAIVFLRNKANIQDDDIISVQPIFSISNKYLKPSKSLLMLIRVRAIIVANINLEKSILNLVDNFNIKHKKYIIKLMLQAKSSLEDILAVCGIKPNIVEIIATAKQTGEVNNSIAIAISALEDEMNIKEQLGSVIASTIFKLVFAVVIMLVLPFFIAESFVKSKALGLDLRANFVTDFLLLIANNFVNILVVLALIVVCFYLFKDNVWSILTKFYPFKIIEQINRAKLTLTLLSLLLPNHKAGIVFITSIKQFAKLSSYSKRQANIIKDNMQTYQLSFSQSLVDTKFTEWFVNAMHDFESTNKDIQTLTLETAINLLKKELLFNNKIIALIANITSGSVILVTIFSLFAGFVLPRILATPIIN